MDFPMVVLKYGEETTKLALTMLVSRIRGVIDTRTESAVDGVLVMTPKTCRPTRCMSRVPWTIFPSRWMRNALSSRRPGRSSGLDWT